MAGGGWAVYFGDKGENADRGDSDELVINEDDGWRVAETGTLEYLAMWVIREFNDGDLPDPDDNLLRILQYPDDSINDGEKVVL